MKTVFRDNDWPQWANFLVRSWSPKPFGSWYHRGGKVHLSAKNRIFQKKASKSWFQFTNRYIFYDNSGDYLVSWVTIKNCSPIGQKCPRYGRIRMPIYGIIDILMAILAHNLAKYQYFSMRPGLFDKYHQITYSLQFFA